MKTFIKKIHAARAAFTLMEVNLAVFIMAVGVLAMTALYPLGFRESQQSRDDVRAAIVANEVLGQLTAALSSRNITWDDWEGTIQSAVDKTPNGWLSYFDQKGDKYVVKSRPQAKDLASGAFDKLADLCKNGNLHDPFSDSKYAYGFVVQWGKRVVLEQRASGGLNDPYPHKTIAVDDHSRVSISFRMARRSGALMAAPIYYTEVHFQGDQADEGNGQ